MRVWIPTISMLLVSLISYIDRNTLALLAPTILKETGLSGEQYGFIISAFSIAYMIGNPVWGVLLDRFGLRRGMTAAVSFWTLASVAHAFAGGLFSFAGARMLLGFGEGATFPGGLRTAVQTLPPGSRSRGIAVSYSGGSLGAIVTPLIVTPIFLRFGWRGAFWFTGLVGLIWLAIWWWVSRGIPDAPGSKTIRTDRPRALDGRVWAFMSAYAFGGLPLAFVIYGAAIYLTKVQGLSQTSLGHLLWIPPLGWELGYFFWGWISDRFRRRGLISYHSVLLAAALLSLPLALTPYAGSLPLVMFELFFAMFVAAGFVILSIAYATDVFSSEDSGLIAGLGAGAWSAAVALIMPVFGRLFDQQRYELAFLIAALFPVAGYVLWTGLTTRSAKGGGSEKEKPPSVLPAAH
jgi:ACS family hexuronate transporter-like MFS transporter